MFAFPTRLRLLALAFGLSAAAAQGAPAPGSAEAAIIKPLTLVSTDDLNFGNVLVGASGIGTVVINPNSGAATYAGGTGPVSGATSSAIFAGRASRLSLVYVTLPPLAISMVRVGGTETLTVGNWTIDSGGQLRLVGTAPFAVRVGATLTVPSTAVDGVYAGQFTVTINYY